MSPTPRPWMYQKATHASGIEKSWNFAIVDHEHKILAETVAKVRCLRYGDYDLYPAEANAALIVRAVNSYDAMREALHACIERLNGLSEDGPILAQAMAALALAVRR